MRVVVAVVRVAVRDQPRHAVVAAVCVAAGGRVRAMSAREGRSVKLREAAAREVAAREG